MNIPTEKDRLRSAIKQRLARLSPEDRLRESRSLCKRLMAGLPEKPGVACVFYPMTGSEADIREIFPMLLERGWQIFFPRFEGSGFAFRRVHAVDALVVGRYGLLEPSHDDDPLDVRTVDLVLIPGLAFDASGNRLGRGNGGYDRWLKELRSKNPHAIVWGIALECQMVTTIPKEIHDETVDAVWTHRGFTGPGVRANDPR